MKTSPWDNFLVEALWQVLLIVSISVALSLSVNYFRRDGLLLVADSASLSSDTESGKLEKLGIPTIRIDEARALFLTNGAIFIDARPAEVYRAGHIRGALNLPPESLEESLPAIMEQVPQDSFIIAYCDGEECPLSREAALQLSAKGYSNVQVLVNGWSAWEDAGLPTER